MPIATSDGVVVGARRRVEPALPAVHPTIVQHPGAEGNVLVSAEWLSLIVTIRADMAQTDLCSRLIPPSRDTNQARSTRRLAPEPDAAELEPEIRVRRLQSSCTGTVIVMLWLPSVALIT